MRFFGGCPEIRSQCSLLEGSHLSRCNRSNILQDLVLDIITGGIVNPSKREIRFFQRSTHHLFVIHDLKGDRHSSYEQLRSIPDYRPV